MPFDFDFTQDQLVQCVPRNKNPKDLFQALNEVLPKYEIITINRVAAFLAQCGHESADFTVLQENLNYSAERLNQVFPRYFPTLESAEPYSRNPEKIANKIYGGRMGNGPESSGDGYRYRGRGAIQLTGHDNYQAFAESIGKSIDEAVSYCETLAGAVESACWFWKRHELNVLADASDIEKMTRKINGGLNGLDDRQARYQRALSILGAKGAEVG